MICTESWILFILHSQKIPSTPSKSTFIFLPCCVSNNRRNKDIKTKDLDWVSLNSQTMTIWWLFSKAIRKLLCTDSRITWRLHSCGQVLSERTLALHFRVEIQFQSTFYNYERFETNKGDKIPYMGCDPLTLNTRSAILCILVIEVSQIRATAVYSQFMNREKKAQTLTKYLFQDLK